MALLNVIVLLCVFNGILEVRSKESWEEVFDFDYPDFTFFATVYHIAIRRDTTTSMSKRMEVLSNPIVSKTYSCELPNGQKGKVTGGENYELQMIKVSMPGYKFYLQLVLKLKHEENPVIVPLVIYPTFESYPLSAENKHIMSNTQLSIHKGSTPDKLMLSVKGIFISRIVDEKYTCTFTHEINVRKLDTRPTAVAIKHEITQIFKIMGKGLNDPNYKYENYIRVEELCTTQHLLVNEQPKAQN
ncbi:uncharacterized protein LOC129001224 [Macrosteles quadrilineatus]|uniref:uncharacterized protein LOC129001224 n=1 Tax=Macrosteles quadrilineatus TaxID=74068 RepID=UPI0023E21674|nr:uncharacterized protein LOC129001224 [Macrosteles quadrilineatus]